jgi:hypothetical protein
MTIDEFRRWAVKQKLSDRWFFLVVLSDCNRSIILGPGPLEEIVSIFRGVPGDKVASLAHESWGSRECAPDNMHWVQINLPGDPNLPAIKKSPTKKTLGLGDILDPHAVPPQAYYCTNCSGWVLPRYVSQSKTMGGIALNTGGPFTPVRLLTQSTEVPVCSRCGKQLSLNAGEYAKKLEKKEKFQKNHPTLASMKKLFGG